MAALGYFGFVQWKDVVMHRSCISGPYKVQGGRSFSSACEHVTSLADILSTEV